jgi:adenylate cyclase
MPARELSTRRLSIIVLPFRWHGGRIDGGDIAQAMTDALTVELGKLQGSTVIAYEIARWYAAGPDDLRTIRENLQVRYAVEGSLRRIAGTLHVTIRLVCTESGIQLWADRFEHVRRGTAVDQEAIVRRLSSMVSNALFRAASARIRRERPGNPDAMDLVVRAQALWSEQTSLQRCAEAQALFDQALALDPQCLPSLVGCAHTMLVLYADRLYWLDGDEPERLDKLITDAQAIAPNDQSVLVCAATWLERQGLYESAMPLAQRLMESHPRNPNGYVRAARCTIFSGKPEAAIPLLEKAIQLDPYGPQLYDRYWRLGFALLLAQREREATQWFQRSLGARPHGP